MTKTYRALLGVVLIASSLSACNEYLVTQPQTILTDEQVWSDPTLVNNVLANYYSRLPQHQTFEGGFEDFASYDEALWSGASNGPQVRNSAQNYGFGYAAWVVWGGISGYGLIRDLNLAIDKIREGKLPEAQKSEFLAELRFLRAQMYFELVKRNGGVPLITEQLIYKFDGDVTSLQVPRASEAAVYDFIAAEVDSVVNKLGNAGNKTRANRYTALALKSRAMLYAGSIAKYNATVPGLTLPGDIVGIPANLAAGYFEKSLAASKAIIDGGQYSLVGGGGEGFASIFYTEPNTEVIFAEDYAYGSRSHQFTMHSYPQSVPHVASASFLGADFSPTLQLVETFDYVNGTPGELKGVGNQTVASQANWIYYDQPQDIFAGKDNRLFGTVISPGSTFSGQPVFLQGGVYAWNAAANSYNRVVGAKNSRYGPDGGLLTGADGPVVGESYASATGFLLRKQLDPSPTVAANLGNSANWWVLYRLGEIYMNAAEAAFELGQTPVALGYINTLRQRAGFPANSLTTLSIAKIQSERWVELSFEDHRLWDLKRWRIAHLRWDGVQNSPTAQAQALWPYRIYRPGHPNHNKYVFDKIVSPIQTAPRFFRPGNYYSAIPQGAIDANPKLIRNPLQQ